MNKSLLTILLGILFFPSLSAQFTYEKCGSDLLLEQNLLAHSLLGSLVDRANFGHPHEDVCGVGDNYMVIDQKGQVSRCQMEIERSVTDIWATDPLSEIRLYDQDFQNLAVDFRT